jgi:hypothetical protein
MPSCAGLVPGIHVFAYDDDKDVDGRDEPGRGEGKSGKRE